MKRGETVGIVGAGTFGTALGSVLARAGRRVILWSRDVSVVEAIQTTRRCPRLPGAMLPEPLEATADPRRLASEARFLVLAVSSKDVRDRSRELGDVIDGSHIVVHRLFEHDHAYIFQNADGRIVFALPYERDFTLIGTTDEDFSGDPRDARISDAETDYLLAMNSSDASTRWRVPIDADISTGPAVAGNSVYLISGDFDTLTTAPRAFNATTGAWSLSSRPP